MELATSPSPAQGRFRHVLILFAQRYSFDILSGVSEFARSGHWYFSPLSWSGDEPIRIPASTCDGILVADEFHPEILGEIARSGIPAVSMTARGESGEIPRVIGDHRQIGRLAAEHFLERGFRRFTYFGIPDNPSSELRRQGYGEALAERGLAFSDLTRRPADFSHGSPSLLLWDQDDLRAGLERLTFPNAVFCFNDPRAVALLVACRELGYRVPVDIAILGVDNDAILCSNTEVTLSSVRHDLHQVGYQAAECLDRLMRDGAPAARTVLVPPRGIASRQSTDALASYHPELTKALAFIRAHFREPIGLAEVTAATGLPTRTLQALFRSELQTDVTSTITRVRLSRARELLVQSNESITAIAARCGFNGVEYFHRVFKKHLNCTPRAYRIAQS